MLQTERGHYRANNHLAFDEWIGRVSVETLTEDVADRKGNFGASNQLAFDGLMGEDGTSGKRH